MNLFQEGLARAAEELGLRIQLDFVIKLPSGRQILAPVYFPDLGSPKGMLVSPSREGLGDIRDEFLECGYGASFFDEPSLNEEYDVASYAEMFADWGWGGAKEDRPSWMDEFAPDDNE